MQDASSASSISKIQIGFLHTVIYSKALMDMWALRHAHAYMYDSVFWSGLITGSALFETIHTVL